MAATYQTSYTPDAQAQIDEILDYYLEKHSLDLAIAIQNVFLDALKKAAKMPTAYPLDGKFISKSGREYRRIIAKNYTLIYGII
ncbi:type II toxin-antitoxin system RelE/ParE family toxin [Neolewinella persica]|uniref:type II toxin-antitoxin system RelE/ParE family toxin n=1 Tax=Neolewinella persica TaxID=70998 RepID=UPI00037C2439